MNVKRYFGRTNKEAMARLRAALGPDAVVLKNHAVNGGVEILAMTDESMLEAEIGDRVSATAARTDSKVGADLRQSRESQSRPEPAQPAQAQSRPEPARPPQPQARAGFERRERAQSPDEPNAPTQVPEMSTLSFQQYVRDRLAQKKSQPPTLGEVVGDAGTRVASGRARMAQEPGLGQSRAAEVPAAAAPVAADAPIVPARTPAATQHTPASVPVATPAATDTAQARMMAELRDMRSFIAEQFGSMAFFDGVRRNPLHARLLRQLLCAGFSPALARHLVSRVPARCTDEQAGAWLRKALERNLDCDSGASLLAEGGIFAMVGPTGVGKTTSTAKIAARFALEHGTQSIGLVTVDAYRIGGQDQLRSFGRMLGVPVHVAHDAATLADFLHLYTHKKLVLIDTAGIGQRDERVDELLASLSSTVVRKLLVLNAASQAETLDDVCRAYRGSQAAGVVISKTDEAVKLGGVLDCALRHRLKLIGVANGQRVPEDWSAPDARLLVEQALSAASSPVFAFDDTDLPLMFSAGTTAAASAGALHA